MERREGREENEMEKEIAYKKRYKIYKYKPQKNNFQPKPKERASPKYYEKERKPGRKGIEYYEVDPRNVEEDDYYDSKERYLPEREEKRPTPTQKYNYKRSYDDLKDDKEEREYREKQINYGCEKEYQYNCQDEEDFYSRSDHSRSGEDQDDYYRVEDKRREERYIGKNHCNIKCTYSGSDSDYEDKDDYDYDRRERGRINEINKYNTSPPPKRYKKEPETKVYLRENEPWNNIKFFQVRDTRKLSKNLKGH